MAKAIDYTDLEAKMELLTGVDFQAAERACRKEADAAPILTTSSVFQAHLAARALGVEYAELKKLPVKDYNAITQVVMAFLFAPSDEVQKP